MTVSLGPLTLVGCHKEANPGGVAQLGHHNCEDRDGGHYHQQRNTASPLPPLAAGAGELAPSSAHQAHQFCPRAKMLRVWGLARASITVRM